MIDRRFLADWVRPQHLEEGALRAYREAFLVHPARLVVLRSVLAERVAARLARFLTVEAEFRTARGVFPGEEAATEAEFRGAGEADQFYRFGRLCGVRAECRLSPGFVTFMRFRHACLDARFRAFFEELTGLPLGRINVNAHSMRRGDFLRAHSDAEGTRRLAFVFYLSPRWEVGYGGALHVVKPAEGAWEVPADYNNLVLFDVTARTEHFVKPIEPAAGARARVTVSGWLHA